MNFTVEWDRAAELQLARIWFQAIDPAAVAHAQAQIDRLLARNPHGHGHHLSEGLWQIKVPPLAANYSIDDPHRLVQVSWVKPVP